MKKKFFLLLIICSFSIFLIMLLLPAAGAVGIATYASTLNPTVDFELGKTYTFSYILMPTAGFIMNYEVNITGDLEKYFTASQNIIKDVFPAEQRNFNVRLTFPMEKIPAGLHQTRICVLETEAAGGGTFGVRTQACSVVAVRSLYAEKYLKIENFFAPNVDVGDIANFELQVKSWTESDIGSVKGSIEVFGPSEKGFEEKIAVFNTETTSLRSNEERVLHASMNTRNMESGEYEAIATVNYDGEEVNASTRFKIGALAIKVINYTREFQRGKVNKFEIDIESRWNRLIEEAYGEVFIEGEESTLKTPSVSLKPWSRDRLLTYWDIPADKEPKEYGGRIIVHYEENKTEENVRLNVKENKEEIKRRKLAIAGFSTAIILMLVLALSIYLRLIKRKQKGSVKRTNRRSGSRGKRK